MKKARAVIEILKKYPSHTASVTQLSAELDVSENTIRRYILKLEKNGKIIRYHGGAVLKEDSIYHKDSLSAREKINTEQKQKIATYAGTLAVENNIVFVDVGTTCKLLLEVLLGVPNLTIITPYLNIKKLTMKAHKTTKVIIPGGIYDSATEGVFGVFTEDFFTNIRPQLAFIGVNGVSDVGISINNTHETGYKRVVIATSEKSIALADSSKINYNGISVVTKIEAIDLIITNQDKNSEAFVKKHPQKFATVV